MKQSCKPRRACGLTMIEALVTLSILSVLTVMAVPTLSGMLHDNRLVADTNGLISALALARTEAIKTGHRVVLCKGSTEDGCSQGPEGWQRGWMVFVDANNNAVRDTAPHPEERLIFSRTPSRGANIMGNTHIRNYVSYTPMGHTRTIVGALQVGTFTICRADTVGLPAKQLVINSMGRVRIQRLASFNCPST